MGIVQCWTQIGLYRTGLGPVGAIFWGAEGAGGLWRPGVPIYIVATKYDPREEQPFRFHVFI